MLKKDFARKNIFHVEEWMLKSFDEMILDETLIFIPHSRYEIMFVNYVTHSVGQAQKLPKTSLFLTMYFNIQAMVHEIQENKQNNSEIDEKQEIDQLQTAPHGRRMVGI